MKRLISPFFILALIQFTSPAAFIPKPPPPLSPSQNLFIITLDGFRWQEVFKGADSNLINNENFTPDAETVKMLYWDNNLDARRKKLMPFFWNVLVAHGSLYGNRDLDNKVNNANIFSISYPGYNEMLTGNTDILVSSNKKTNNPNKNVLEYLNEKPGFAGKIAAFTSWDVFPFILNTERNNLPVNSGYENAADENSVALHLINKVQDDYINDKGGTRYDQLTFLTAKEYIQKNKPRVAFIGLGETDEMAHSGRYDLYLEKAN